MAEVSRFFLQKAEAKSDVEEYKEFVKNAPENIEVYVMRFETINSDSIVEYFDFLKTKYSGKYISYSTKAVITPAKKP